MSTVARGRYSRQVQLCTVVLVGDAVLEFVQLSRVVRHSGPGERAWRWRYWDAKSAERERLLGEVEGEGELGAVDAEREGDEVQRRVGAARVQEVDAVRQERQRLVAEEGNVVVVGYCEKEKRVGGEGGQEALLHEEREEEKLEDVENEKEREEGVAMHVERVHPFHLLLHVARGMHPQVLIRYHPCAGSEHGSDEYKVEEHRAKHHSQEGPWVGDLEGDAVGDGGDEEEPYTQHGESGVVSCPLILRLFVPRCMLVDFLRIDAKGHHLPESVLEVHLWVFDCPAYVLWKEGSAAAVPSRCRQHIFGSTKYVFAGWPDQFFQLRTDCNSSNLGRCVGVKQGVGTIVIFKR
mmetsp:Transcript_58961/g.120717  ORF Transcript_58961/g.120717 Transcript_58961/m.120717 type:complete len:350 (-) Transcript_58961:260-1309(-)|eukprot:CAMPEP_0181299666 /NCGR_PEP_ID=MMETSP1101-20121128/6471_1 /TAXON_ID=46948 /ORGANISM="Rhodomonas abbreviata, Strain Caron Lab Isolate" /LENGTH=349 /DNA_ID=CAMNT_0023404837 /DNA_START=91 /DNA_END=1140 /DNA_ORIENTATION=+